MCSLSLLRYLLDACLQLSFGYDEADHNIIFTMIDFIFRLFYIKLILFT